MRLTLPTTKLGGIWNGPGTSAADGQQRRRSRPFACDIHRRLRCLFLTILHAYAAVGFPDDHGELLLATETCTQ